jgi:uncharacterized protein
MFVVDTNVLLCAVNTSATEHVRCRQLLDQWRSQLLPWHTTRGILYEFTRVATHPRVFERPWTIEAAWAAVQAILAAPHRQKRPCTEVHGLRAWRSCLDHLIPILAHSALISSMSLS